MTKEELQRAMRAHLATLDPENKWYMPDLISTKNKSENQNAYLWTLCQRIAEKLHSTKEEIYREAIRKVGVFEFVAMRTEAAEAFINDWCNKGIGWYAEIMDGCKIEGCERVVVYRGTSEYTREQERVLIDYIVEEAKELGIETLTENELKQMGVIA